MPRATIHHVADFFIWAAHETGDCLTNLKLQKLAYYAEAWFHGLYNRPLTGARFEAWVHGPVSPVLYDRFKVYGFNPISERVEECPDLSADVREHLEETLDVFNRFSAWDLERMTHAEFPWQNARGDLAPDDPGTTAISTDDMREYCLQLTRGGDGEEQEDEE